MSVRVRDLEIALVLAREMKAAAERSVDASLRLDQLQEVFGVQELDRAERARIQTALQMAGLEPYPSLLEADPDEPIRFGASKAAVAAGAIATSAPSAPPPPSAPSEEPGETDAQPTFPTVGQFARSKMRSRRFGVRRGDHGEDGAPPPQEPFVETNGHVPDEVEIEPEPVVDELHEEIHEEEPEAHEYEEPPEPEPEHELEHESDEHEYVPPAPPEPVAHEEPEPQPRGASAGEVAAVLVPAVAIPVIVTSLAGWRFGLPFVALTVIAAGWVMSREKRGFIASIRASRAARTALTLTAVVTVLSGVAAVVLASLPDSSSTTKKPAAPARRAVQPPVASKPVTPAPEKKKAKAKAKRAKHSTATNPAPTAATPPPDPATQGLIRVPPSSGGTGGTTTTP